MNTTSIGKVGKRQRGSIMLVALVLLFVVTLLAMSGLQTASVQERMALNAQSSNLAFQSAETAVNSVLWKLQDGDVALIDEAREGDNGKGSVEVVAALNPGVQITVQVQHLGTIPVYGNSIGKDGEIKAQAFEIAGVVTIESTGASSSVTQGIAY